MDCSSLPDLSWVHPCVVCSRRPADTASTRTSRAPASVDENEPDKFYFRQFRHAAQFGTLNPCPNPRPCLLLSTSFLCIASAFAPRHLSLTCTHGCCGGGGVCPGRRTTSFGAKVAAVAQRGSRRSVAGCRALREPILIGSASELILLSVYYLLEFLDDRQVSPHPLEPAPLPPLPPPELTHDRGSILACSRVCASDDGEGRGRGQRPSEGRGRGRRQQHRPRPGK